MSIKYKFSPIKKMRKICLGLSMAAILFTQSLTVFATSDEPSVKELNIARNQTIPIDSNGIPDWPEGPVVSASSAILMDADTGTILYAKDIHSHHYPASTTKILTTLIAAERCSLDEVVTFSHDAVFGIPRNSNHIAMNEGDTLTMEQCLNAILIRSANEVSYAVAEHIGETWEGFADIMNERAKELGAVDSHFVNPNGLPDEDHYVSAYDMAMIGRAFFANEMLCKITLTSQLVIPKEEEDLVEWNQMKLIPGREYAYEYLVGCKTGYTDAARQTLVSCAEKDGLKLICVVLEDEAPFQYEDTITLFEYGFSNFQKLNVSQTETKYNIDTTGSFYSGSNLFGSSDPMLALNKESCIVLPKTADFSDTESAISYETGNSHQAAIITYTYHDVPVGTASVDLNISEENSYTFDTDDPASSESNETSVEPAKEKSGPSVIFINIFKVLLWMVGIALIVFLIIVIFLFLKNYQLSLSNRNNRRNWQRHRRRRRRRKSSLEVSNDLRKKRQAQIKRSRKRRKKKSPHKFRDYDY